MSAYTDEFFIDQLSGVVSGFGWERAGLARMSCPFCSDTHKRRGYFIKNDDKDTYFYHCHNCDDMNGRSVAAVLKVLSTPLFNRYCEETFEEKANKNQNRKTIEQIAAEEKRKKLAKARVVPMFRPKPRMDAALETLTAVKDLDPEHTCRKYVSGRQIPERAYEWLYYTNDWKRTCEAFDVEEKEAVAKLWSGEPRLVIPFFSTTGELEVMQGRSLDPDNTLRYITIKKTAKTEKIYGLERLNFNKPKLVVEGPIDSLFLPNCVAKGDANLIGFEQGDIYIPDNQYRNAEISRYMRKIIESGKKVVIFPDWIHGKDINDIHNELGVKGLLDVIRNNIYQGFDAELEFNRLDKSPRKKPNSKRGARGFIR